MKIAIFAEKYTEFIDNQFIQDFFLSDKITCGLFFCKNGLLEIRTNIDKNLFIERLSNTARLFRLFYNQKEPTNIRLWKNYLYKNRDNFKDNIKIQINSIYPTFRTIK